MASPPPSVRDELIASFSKLFPDNETHILRAALFVNDWNLDDAAIWLLEQELVAPPREVSNVAPGEGGGVTPGASASAGESRSAATAAPATAPAAVETAPEAAAGSSSALSIDEVAHESALAAGATAEVVVPGQVAMEEASPAAAPSAAVPSMSALVDGNGDSAMTTGVSEEVAVAEHEVSVVKPSDDGGSICATAGDNVGPVAGQEAEVEESSLEGMGSSSQYWDVDKTLGEEEAPGGALPVAQSGGEGLEGQYEGSKDLGADNHFGMNSISASMLESVTSSSGRPEGLRADDLQRAIETAVAEKNEVTDELRLLRGRLVEVRAEQQRAAEECSEANRAADAICAEVTEYRRISDLAKQTLEARSADLFGTQQQLADDQWRLLRDVRKAEKSTRGVLVELQAIRTKLELRSEAVQKQRQEAVDGKAARLAEARRDLEAAKELHAGIIEQEKMLKQKEDDFAKDELALQDGAHRVDELQGRVDGLLEDLESFKRDVALFLDGEEAADEASPSASASHEQLSPLATAVFPMSSSGVTLQLPPVPAGTEFDHDSNSSSLMVFHALEEPPSPVGASQQKTPSQQQQQEGDGESSQSFYEDYPHQAGSPRGDHASDSSNSSSGHASAYPPVPLGNASGPEAVSRPSADLSMSLPQSYGSQDLSVFRSGSAQPSAEEPEWEILNPVPSSPSSSSDRSPSASYSMAQ